MSVEGEKSGVKYISEEDKKRFENLFNFLDTNKDGTVDIQELTAALKGRKEPSRQAAVHIDYYCMHDWLLSSVCVDATGRPLTQLCTEIL